MYVGVSMCLFCLASAAASTAVNSRLQLSSAARQLVTRSLTSAVNGSQNSQKSTAVRSQPPVISQPPATWQPPVVPVSDLSLKKTFVTASLPPASLLTTSSKVCRTQ